jgi:hypothetical protein
MEGQTPGNNGVPGKYDYSPKTGLELYDLENDPAETTDLADANPVVMDRLTTMAMEKRRQLGDTRTKIEGTATRPSGRVSSGS